jgi:hypothetical protein
LKNNFFLGVTLPIAIGTVRLSALSFAKKQKDVASNALGIHDFKIIKKLETMSNP